MWLTSLSIKRPLLMLMVISVLLVVGLVSWARLPVDLFPALDYPIVTITTAYPGAGPDAVDTLVTKKIEDAIAGMNDIDYIQSSSYEGVSSVFIVFTDKASKDSAIEAERRVNGIRGQLPTDIRAPSVGKYNPNEQPVLVLALSGNRDLGQLQRIAEDKVQKRLEAMGGIGQVSLIGGLEREVQVQVDQQKVQARGLSILQVNQALSGDNVNVPAGNLTERGKDWTVRLNNQAQTPEELNSVLIASTPAGPVYLRDVATVVDTYKRVQTVQRTDGKPALGITLVKTSSANAIDTVDGVKREIKKLERELPADVRIDVILDGSIFTRNSVHDVQTELTQAVALTGLVLLVFLHTFRATAIVLLAIPTSLIATLGVVYFMGFSLNMMSLMGLTLTVGILVDDSIVVLENIFRHLQAGEEPSEAARNGRSEIGFAAIAITLVDIVVFAPIAFMGSFVGQWFRQFGLVIATATLFSLFVSFTLTPMLASRWYRKGQRVEEEEVRTPTRNPLTLFARFWDRGYERLTWVYSHVLRGALRFRWLTVAVGLGSFVGGILLVTTGLLSSEFMPTTDDGRLVVNVEMPAGTTLERTDAVTRKVEERVFAWPEVERVSTSVGVGGGTGFLANQARFARIQVELKHRSERTRTPKDLAADARTFGKDIPDALVKAAPSSFFENTAAPIAIRVTGENQQAVASLATQVANIVKSVPGTADVSDGGVTGQPELVVSIDRERAADVGLSPGQVASVLRTGLAGSAVSTFRPEGTRGWDLTVILDPSERARSEQVTEIPIITPRGSTVRLGQVAQISTVNGPTQVDRRDRERTVFVLAQLDGRTLGDVTADIQRELDRAGVPADKIKLGGDAEDQADSFLQIFQALGLSVLLMYMLMVALFESLLIPFVIMLSLPLAVIGAFGLLVLTGHTLNMMSLIGMILLTGLVGKNAILLVDYTNTLRRQGMSRNAALLHAGPVRLRPILMTTSALVLAMLPIALALGEGGEFRAPMAVTVIGGLITSTLLTLVMIPAVYTIMDDFRGVISGIPDHVRRLVQRLARPSAAGAEAGTTRHAPTPLPVPVSGGSDQGPLQDS